MPLGLLLLLLVDDVEQGLATVDQQFDIIGLLGDVGTLHGAIVELVPVETLEVRCSLECWEPLGEAYFGDLVEELLDKASGLRVLKEGGVPDGALQDDVVDLVGVLEFFGEGQLSADELVEEDAHGPDVDCEGVALAEHYLRRHVVRCADYGEGPEALGLLELLGGAHVDQLQVAVVLYHHVLGLQVPVDDILEVQTLHHEHKRRQVEDACASVQDPDLPDHVEQLPALDVLQQKEDFLAVLEALDEPQHHREVQLLQNVLLFQDDLFHLILNYLLLLNALYRVIFRTALRLTYQIHLSELPLPQLLHKNQVLQHNMARTGFIPHTRLHLLLVGYWLVIH